MSTPVTSTSTKDSCVTSLLTWKDPIKSGKVFGGAVASLIIFKYVNLLNVFFRLAYMGLLASATIEYASKLVTGEGIVSKRMGSTCVVSKALNEQILPAIGNAASEFFPQVQKLVFSTNVENTLKAAGGAYILYKVTSWFSLYTLAFASIVIAFTVPAFYFANQKEIDAAVHKYGAIAKDKASEFTTVAHKQVSPHIENLVKKTGPIGDFISSKIPTRTAGSTVGASTPSTTFTSKVEAAADKADTELDFDNIKSNTHLESTAKSSGASQFPDVPSPLKTDIKHAVEEVEAAHPPAPSL